MKNFVRSIALFTVLVAALIVTWTKAVDAQQSADVSSHPWIGKAAPEFALQTVGDGELKLNDLRGKFVVIHFGASW